MEKIKKNIKNKIITFIRLLGYDFKKLDPNINIPQDFDKDSLEIYRIVKDLTLMPPGRFLSLIQSVKYIEENNIKGDFVECGVYRGGAVLTIALTLEKFYPNSNRKIWLYDTFAGMTRPTECDVSSKNTKALEKFGIHEISSDSSDWCYCSLEEVQNNIFNNTAYNKDNFQFIKGKVEDTIPKYSPDKIALLRLDTDWYESTKYELLYLYPILTTHGVLILDDYGHWTGNKKAVDEYFSEKNIKIFLSRTDYSCRTAIKIN